MIQNSILIDAYNATTEDVVFVIYGMNWQTNAYSAEITIEFASPTVAYLSHAPIRRHIPSLISRFPLLELVSIGNAGVNESEIVKHLSLGWKTPLFEADSISLLARVYTDEVLVPGIRPISVEVAYYDDNSIENPLQVHFAACEGEFLLSVPKKTRIFVDVDDRRHSNSSYHHT